MEAVNPARMKTTTTNVNGILNYSSEQGGGGYVRLVMVVEGEINK